MSPRTVLRRVIERAAALGLRGEDGGRSWRSASSARTRRACARRTTRDLRPLNPGLNCYSISHASIDDDVVGGAAALHGRVRHRGRGLQPRARRRHVRDEPSLRATRWRRPTAAMLFKSGAKEVLAQSGVRADVHGEVLGRRWTAAAATSTRACGATARARSGTRRRAHGMSATMRRTSRARSRRCRSCSRCTRRTSTRYKRYVGGSWAPTAATWGIENRTVGAAGDHRRPSGDPRRASRAGRRREPVPRVRGVPRGRAVRHRAQARAAAAGAGQRLRGRGPAAAAAHARAGDRAARRAATSRATIFGDAFVDHYVAMRRWEVEKHRRAVTAWERRRYFEQVLTSEGRYAGTDLVTACTLSFDESAAAIRWCSSMAGRATARTSRRSWRISRERIAVLPLDLRGHGESGAPRAGVHDRRLRGRRRVVL